MNYITKDNVNFFFSKDIKPVLKVKSGETVVFQCMDCYYEQITEDRFDYTKVDRSLINPATGPLFIEGSEPGDVLKIEIEKIEIAPAGVSTSRNGDGVYKVKGNNCRVFEVKENEIIFEDEVRIPIKPMIGVIGVAPTEGQISTHAPGEHGGNMDIRDLGQGTILYLPVNVEGALLSMGDLHAVQGDGETSSCALEISGSVQVKVSVIKNLAELPTPFIITPASYLTTAADQSLDNCSVTACRKMQDFIMNFANRDDVDSSILLGLAGNLRISQVVNPLKGCIMEFPKDLIKISSDRL